MEKIYAVTDRNAKLHFSASNYAALEAGDVHGLTADEVADVGEAFECYDEAVTYLRARDGGGWAFGTDLESNWISA